MPERVKTVGQELLPWAGWFSAFLAVIGAILFNRRKVAVDESALVLGKWKELVDTHQAQIKMIREEFAEYKKSAVEEIASLRHRLTEVEAAFAEFRLMSAEHIRKRDDEIAGLKRAIAQNSQSTAAQIGRVKDVATKAGKRADKAEVRADGAQSRVDRLTTDKNDAHDTINENLERLNRMGDNIRKAADDEEPGQ